MDEATLVALIKQKDDEAFNQLVNKYKPVIEKFAFQFGVSPEHIPDIVQDVFIKVYRKIHLYNTGKLTTWMYQITLNIAKDHFRKQKRNQNLLVKAKQSQRKENITNNLFEKDEHVFLHECIQQLNAKYRIPIILFYFHDKSYEEIASVLKIKTSVVKTRLHRGKKLLKKEMEALEMEEVYLHG